MTLHYSVRLWDVTLSCNTAVWIITSGYTHCDSEFVCVSVTRIEIFLRWRYFGLQVNSFFEWLGTVGISGHRCVLYKENGFFLENAPRRCVREKQSLWEFLDTEKSGIHEVFKQNIVMMPLMLPVFETFPIIEIHTSVGIYALFRFEPLDYL